MMFIFFIIIAVVIYFVYQSGSIEFKSKPMHNTLDERLASGEISVEKYREIKNVLHEVK